MLLRENLFMAEFFNSHQKQKVDIYYEKWVKECAESARHSDFQKTNWLVCEDFRLQPLTHRTHVQKQKHFRTPAQIYARNRTQSSACEHAA